MSATALPSLSELLSWDTIHLTEGADYWESIANRWQITFNGVPQQLRATGWEGKAADKANDRAYQDAVKIGTVADDLREGARIAREGAPDEYAALNRLRYAVEDAQDAGFGVYDDYTVADRRTGGTAAEQVARQAQAQGLAGHIRDRAAQLVGLDQQIGARVTAAVGHIGNLTFDEHEPVTSGTEEPSDEQRNGVQPVDNRFPQTPFPTDRPWQYNLDLTATTTLDGAGHPSAGTIAGIDDVWEELNRCFNCNFPIGGAPREFPKVGDKLPLEMRIAGQKLANLPVQVTQIQKTADEINIEFATLPGHEDGPGSTIHFRFFEQGGELHLGIRGYITHGPGSETGFPGSIYSPGARVGYTGLANATWQQYIDRLTYNIATAKGQAPYLAPYVATPNPYG